MYKFFTIVTLTIIVSSLAFSYEVGKQDNTDRVVGIWKSLKNINSEPQAVVTVNRSEKQKENGKPAEDAPSFVMKRARTN